MIQELPDECNECYGRRDPKDWEEMRILSKDFEEMRVLTSKLLAGAHKCSLDPHYIVQPFMNIILTHKEIINKFHLMDGIDE